MHRLLLLSLLVLASAPALGQGASGGFATVAVILEDDSGKRAIHTGPVALSDCTRVLAEARPGKTFGLMSNELKRLARGKLVDMLCIEADGTTHHMLENAAPRSPDVQD